MSSGRRVGKKLLKKRIASKKIAMLVIAALLEEGKRWFTIFASAMDVGQILIRQGGPLRNIRY